MPEVLPLWPDGAIGSESWKNPEKEYSFSEPWAHRIIRNVSNPTLTIFLPEPDAATGTGVIVCPGGGHHFLAIDHEGYDVARWLNTHGIAAFVLKYRVIQTPDDEAEFLIARENMGESLQNNMPTHLPIVIADGQQALRVVRRHANEWGLNPKRIGMMGFSAGAHLTALVTIVSESDIRPDFIAPIYGGLWGWGASEVKADLPPLFAAIASDDLLALDVCVGLYSAWIAAKNSAELHCYASGGHGFGMIPQGLPTDTWIERFYEWLGALGMVDDKE